MISTEDLPKLPNKDILIAIKTVSDWTDNPSDKSKAPTAEQLELVYSVGDDKASTEIIKSINDAYTNLIKTDKNELDITVAKYIMQLREISDTANLIAAAYVSTLSREELLS